MSGTTENALLNNTQSVVAKKVPGIIALVSQLKQYQAEGKGSTPEFKALADQYKQAVTEVGALVKKSLKDHPEAVSNAPLFYLYGSLLDEEDIQALIASKAACFSTPLLQPLVDQFAHRAEAMKSRQPGSQFKDIALQTPQGATKRLSDYCGKGNYVLVDFWASWCGPCRAEMPRVKALYEKYHSKGFEIVGVSLDNDKAAWTGAIQRMNLTWPHLSDLKGWQSEAAALYGISAIPATLLIDPQGKIIAFGLRGDQLDAKVAELYANADDHARRRDRCHEGGAYCRQGASRKARSQINITRLPVPPYRSLAIRRSEPVGPCRSFPSTVAGIAGHLVSS